MTLILIALACLALLVLGLWLLARGAPLQSPTAAALDEASRYHERAAAIIEKANRQNRPATAAEWDRYNRLMAQHALAMREYDRLTRREERAS
jgi:hypothetical protein